jgi:hypothetical protein
LATLGEDWVNIGRRLDGDWVETGKDWVETGKDWVETGRKI